MMVTRSSHRLPVIDVYAAPTCRYRLEAAAGTNFQTVEAIGRVRISG
jgi:hypothetical protein